MAREKAYDARQHRFEEDARFVVYEWFKKNNLKINKNDIYVCWFAYLSYGYKCMVSSYKNDNLFFEVTKNIKGETRCNCFQRFEYFVEPEQKNIVHIKDDIDDSI